MKPLNPYFQNPNFMNQTPSQPLLGQQIPGKQSLTELIGSRQPMMQTTEYTGKFARDLQNLSPDRRAALEQRMSIPGRPLLEQPMFDLRTADLPRNRQPLRPITPMPPPMNQPLRPTERPLPGTGPDFIDSRQPGYNYSADMVDYIDPATGERTSRTRGVVPSPGSRFVPVNRFQTPNPPTETTGAPAISGIPTRNRVYPTPDRVYPTPNPPAETTGIEVPQVPIYPQPFPERPVQPLPERPVQPLPGGENNIRGPMFQQLPRAVQKQIAKQQRQMARQERKAGRLTGLGKYPDSNTQYMGGSPNFNEQTGAYIS